MRFFLSFSSLSLSPSPSPPTPHHSFPLTWNVFPTGKENSLAGNARTCASSQVKPFWRIVCQQTRVQRPLFSQIPQVHFRRQNPQKALEVPPQFVFQDFHVSFYIMKNDWWKQSNCSGREKQLHLLCWIGTEYMMTQGFKSIFNKKIVNTVGNCSGYEDQWKQSRLQRSIRDTLILKKWNKVICSFSI